MADERRPHHCWRCGVVSLSPTRQYIDDIGRRYLCLECIAHYQRAGHRVSRYAPKRKV